MQERDVDFVGQQACRKVARLALHELDVHGRTRKPVALNKLRHVGVGRKRREAEPQATGLAARRTAGSRDRIRPAADGNARLVKERATSFGQPDATAVALQQRYADLLFEALNAQAERRLRHVQLRGCAPEMQLFGDRDEATHRPQVHGPAQLDLELLSRNVKVQLDNIRFLMILKPTASQGATGRRRRCPEPFRAVTQAVTGLRMIELDVNGIRHRFEGDPATPLLWFLRDELGLTGTRFGCGAGLCGCCTVHVGKDAVRSCSVTLSDLDGATITTIEALGTGEALGQGLGAAGLHPLQRAWVDNAVPQCGYCQSGQLMQAAALLVQKPHPTDADIDAAMSGNLCRCGTYPRIRAAIKQAAASTTIGPAPKGVPKEVP
jgi:isoquinoline 1-oxidoreductase subunit alpha